MRDYYPFPALLSSDYNEVEESGIAQITPRGDALNFYSDFVPLIPFGKSATIHWTLGDKTLATFEGETYLSTSEMLQITGLEEVKLATARTLFQMNTRLPSTIAQSPKKKTPQYEAEVLYLSMGMIKILSSQEISEGQKIYLSIQVDFLTLSALCLIVHKRVDFLEGEKLLLCEVDTMTQENYIALSAYTAKLEKQWEQEENEN